MKINKINLDQVAGFISQFPNDNFDEIAFAGRSNVGKSSFINSFLGKKNLAKTSSKPGKTKTINFYKINDRFRLVDLPGYG
ncbi:MAG: GTPase, partial [Anaerococcus hydrogenalis]|nr:GTPase [Anaerococcus hydrogenalis]